MSAEDFPVLNLEASAAEEPPVIAATRLILTEALRLEASEINARLQDSPPALSLQFIVNGQSLPRAAPPAAMYQALRNLLCQRASITHYETGPVTGELRTMSPESVWTLESDDLRRGFRLQRGAGH